MASWLNDLVSDPLPALLSQQDLVLTYFVRRDLLDEASGPVSVLWDLAEAEASGRDPATGRLMEVSGQTPGDAHRWQLRPARNRFAL